MNPQRAQPPGLYQFLPSTGLACRQCGHNAGTRSTDITQVSAPTCASFKSNEARCRATPGPRRTVSTCANTRAPCSAAWAAASAVSAESSSRAIKPTLPRKAAEVAVGTPLIDVKRFFKSLGGLNGSSAE